MNNENPTDETSFPKQQLVSPTAYRFVFSLQNWLSSAHIKLEGAQRSENRNSIQYLTISEIGRFIYLANKSNSQLISLAHEADVSKIDEIINIIHATLNFVNLASFAIRTLKNLDQSGQDFFSLSHTLETYLSAARREIQYIVNCIGENLPKGYIGKNLSQISMSEKQSENASLRDKIKFLLESEGLPAADIDDLISRFANEIKICKARSSLPKWKDRLESDLERFTAPEFLKIVYVDDINDGEISKDYIRSVDKDLMDAVEAYISQREKRGLSLGRAQGLKFVASRPATNKRAQLTKAKSAKLV